MPPALVLADDAIPPVPADKQRIGRPNELIMSQVDGFSTPEVGRDQTIYPWVYTEQFIDTLSRSIGANKPPNCQHKQAE